MVSKYFTVLLIIISKLFNPCHALKNSVAVKRLIAKLIKPSGVMEAALVRNVTGTEKIQQANHQNTNFHL